MSLYYPWKCNLKREFCLHMIMSWSPEPAGLLVSLEEDRQRPSRGHGLRERSLMRSLQVGKILTWLDDTWPQTSIWENHEKVTFCHLSHRGGAILLRHPELTTWMPRKQSRNVTFCIISLVAWFSQTSLLIAMWWERMLAWQLLSQVSLNLHHED